VKTALVLPLLKKYNFSYTKGTLKHLSEQMEIVALQSKGSWPNTCGCSSAVSKKKANIESNGKIHSQAQYWTK
jgi:hypothetical protein